MYIQGRERKIIVGVDVKISPLTVSCVRKKAYCVWNIEFNCNNGNYDGDDVDGGDMCIHVVHVKFYWLIILCENNESLGWDFQSRHVTLAA